MQYQRPKRTAAHCQTSFPLQSRSSPGHTLSVWMVLGLPPACLCSSSAGLQAPLELSATSRYWLGRVSQGRALSGCPTLACRAALLSCVALAHLAGVSALCSPGSLLGAAQDQHSAWAPSSCRAWPRPASQSPAACWGPTDPCAAKCSLARTQLHNAVLSGCCFGRHVSSGASSS